MYNLRRWFGLGLVLSLSFGALTQTFVDYGVLSESGNNPDIALSDSGSVFAAWTEKADNNVNVFVRELESDVNSAKINVSNAAGDAATPSITVDGAGNPLVVWAEKRGASSDIFFSRSTGGGAGFQPPINLSNTDTLAIDPDIAQGDSLVAVVWTDSGVGDIFLKFSQDSGASFSDAINLSNSNTPSLQPTVAVNKDGRLFVAWVEADEKVDMFFSRSVDRGVTFSDPINLSAGFGAFLPSIAVGPDQEVYIVWQSGFGNIAFVQSQDEGASFGFPSSQFSRGLVSDIAVDPQGNIYALWDRDQTICFSFSTDGGRSFSPPQNFSKGERPAIVARDSKNIYVVAQEQAGTVFVQQGSL